MDCPAPSVQPPPSSPSPSSSHSPPHHDDDPSVDDFQVISVEHTDAAGDGDGDGSNDAPPAVATAVVTEPSPPPQSSVSSRPQHPPSQHLSNSPTTTTTTEPGSTQLTQAHFRSLENWILSAAQFEQASGKSLCDIIRANTKFRPTTNVERLLNLCQVDPFGTFLTPASTTVLSEDHYFDRLVKKYVEGISPS